MRRRVLGVGLLLLALATPSRSQDDAAVDRGLDFLRGADQRRLWPEVVLWAYLCAGVGETDASFRDLARRLDADPWRPTYQIAMRAMIYARLDRDLYSTRLQACARFLVEVQNPGGDWAYGRDRRPAERRRCRRNALVPDAARRVPTLVPGDGSNSLFAALGLRACQEAGVRVAPEVLRRAAGWWEAQQAQDGGWGYRGGLAPCASMTAAGVASLQALKAMLGEDAQEDRAIRRGLTWLAAKKTRGPWPVYTVWAMRQAGAITREEAGAQLLRQQQSDGSWWENGNDPYVGTALALAVLAKPRARELKKIRRDATPTRNELVLAQVALRIDDDPLVPSYAKLVEELRKRVDAGVRAERVPVQLSEDPIENYPFLYLTGHEDVLMTDKEMDALAKHLKRGGFLYIQNCCRSEEFEASARKLVRRVAGSDLAAVAPDHAIHKVRFDTGGLAKLEGVTVGRRLAIVFCSDDICCRWGFEECDDACSKVTAEESFRIVSNIVAYAFSE